MMDSSADNGTPGVNQPAPASTFGAYPPPSATDGGVSPYGTGTTPPRRRFSLGLVAVIILVCALVVSSVLVVALNGKENRDAGQYSADSNGTHYDNPALGIQFSAPAGWEKLPTNDALLLLKREGCVISMIDNTVLYAPASFEQGIRMGAQSNHPDATLGPVAAWHGTGSPHGLTASVPGDSPLLENWFTLRHRLHMTTLIEIYPPENDGCPATFAAFERGFAVR